MSTNSRICQLVGPMEINAKLLDLQMFTILVDGGVNHRLPLSHFISIGDADSADDPTLIQIKYPTDKDLSDFELAIQQIPATIDTLHLHGFIGGRLDHFLSVLGIVQKHIRSDRFKQIIHFGVDQKIVSFKQQLKMEHHGVFSFLSLADQIASIDGDVAYKTNDKFIEALSSLSISNVAQGTITIKCEREAFLIFCSHQLK